MIDCVNCETAHFFGDSIASQFRLRHRVFIERQGWSLPTYHGMEYDEYDTPATTYLVWRDEYGVVRGVSRLNPTDRPYMLKDHWPELVTEIALPSRPDVWEGTRFGVDKDIDPKLRRRIVGELVCGYLEFCLQNDIKRIIGIMPTLIWRAVFIRSGWPVQFIGQPTKMDGDKVAPGIMIVSKEALARVRNKTGNPNPILRTAKNILEQRSEIAA